MSDYAAFISNKLQYGGLAGFSSPWIPEWLFDFQCELVEWACRKGRAAIFADCGLGKTPMQLVWSQNVIQQTNRSVLLVAPLSVSSQTLRESEKFCIPAVKSRDGHLPSDARVVITNYERLHLFDPTDFVGMVCDESSILKNFDGVTKATVTEFMRRMPYRLLCTATAAPNDHIELGTSSEALGELGYTDMLTRFFKNDEGSIAPLSYATKWRFKPHAERHFWRWLCSWARAVRMPSDLGYPNGAFELPRLNTRLTMVATERPLNGRLFVMPAQTLQEQREERRVTIRGRCEAVAARAETSDPFVAWCHLNSEADLLENLIPGARQVSGVDSDDHKEELFDAFAAGELRVLITKPKIGAFGLNWQHCAHLSIFPSHSFEQYYQAVRRCWRFGQTRDVTVEIVTTSGEGDVLGNLQRKSDACDRMFAMMVTEMRQAQAITVTPFQSQDVTLPAWMGV